MSKRSGRKSQGANDFLMPYAPTIDSASNVGTARPYNNGAVTVSFTADPRNAATSFTASGYCSVHSATHTVTGASSPLVIEGFGSEVVTTITVTATNAYGTSAASAASSSVTVTTVPATPSAPSATAQGAAANDDVSWSAPASGGSAITSYDWQSDDSKGANQAGTSVSVAQEAGTAQSYRVRANNANGSSEYSAYSSAVTSFSFTPFSFAPFGAFGFTPFGAFGFTPFGFTPFGFTPYGFSQGGGACIEADTLIRTPNGLVPAKNVNIGDTIVSLGISEIPTLESSGDFDYAGFASSSLTSEGLVEVEVINIIPSVKGQVIYFNGEIEKKYSATQPMFIKREGSYMIIPTTSIVTEDILIKVNEDGSLLECPIVTIDTIHENHTVYQFNCEPQDWFVAGDYLVHNK